MPAVAQPLDARRRPGRQLQLPSDASLGGDSAQKQIDNGEYDNGDHQADEDARHDIGVQ
jgi:hypothetical protein